MKVLRPYLIRAAKLLLRLALDQAVAKALPKIYAKLDQDMPTMLSSYGPKTMANQIQSIAMEAAGKRVGSTQLEAIAGLYSPLAAAARNAGRR